MCIFPEVLKKLRLANTFTQIGEQCSTTSQLLNSTRLTYEQTLYNLNI